MKKIILARSRVEKSRKKPSLEHAHDKIPNSYFEGWQQQDPSQCHKPGLRQQHGRKKVVLFKSRDFETIEDHLREKGLDPFPP